MTTTTSLAVILTTKATNISNNGDKRHRREISPIKLNNSKLHNNPRGALRSDPGPQLKGLKRYKLLNLIGDGSYGLVYLALHLESGENVAIKTMKRKYHSWDEVLDLKEVRSLKKLHHPNVVRLREVMRENNTLYFVFEYVPYDLLDILRQTKADQALPDSFIRHVTLQVLQGLAYMHRLGFFHRDLKPENILISSSLTSTNDDAVKVKIADFGLAREIRSAPPFTDYVSTRWYRAPEVLLRSTNYSSPIDIWAMGCIVCELFTKRPLFPGSSEIDQLYKISSILGTPQRSEWNEGFILASAMTFRFPAFKMTHLSHVLGPRSTSNLVSFLYSSLNWNPSRRFTAVELVRHAFLRSNDEGNNNSNRFGQDLNNEYTPGIRGSKMNLVSRQLAIKETSSKKKNNNNKKKSHNDDDHSKKKNNVDDDFEGGGVFDGMVGIPFGKPGLTKSLYMVNNTDFNRGVTLKDRLPRFSDFDHNKESSKNKGGSFSEWRHNNPIFRSDNVVKAVEEEHVLDMDDKEEEEEEEEEEVSLRQTFELDLFKDNNDLLVGTKYTDLYGPNRNDLDVNESVSSAATKHNGFQGILPHLLMEHFMGLLMLNLVIGADKNAHHALLSKSMPNFNVSALNSHDVNDVKGDSNEANGSEVYYGRTNWANKYLNV